MRTLLLHSEDHPDHGPWAHERWDRVVDLGMATPDAYARWREFFGCEITTVEFANLPPDPVREALDVGFGLLRDEYGIDWWEMLSAPYPQRLYEVFALHGIFDSNPQQEFFASRDCFQVRALEVLTKRRIDSFTQGRGGATRLRRFHRKLRRLSWRQIRQIVADKYDPQHKMRATFASAKNTGSSPAVVLPTAYVNVSRTALAYAKALPESQFLLVAARRSGWQHELPRNVRQIDLAAYFRSHRRHRDHESFVSHISFLRQQLERNSFFRVLAELGLLDDLETNLRRWLVVRDAWLNVFDFEPVMSVLCCDGTNPYTLLPLLIAKHRGIPAILSHHGALDGHYLLKHSQADYILAKGEMERDYLVRRCGIPREHVVIGAPSPVPPPLRAEQSHIVFFSEDYEASGARVDEFYRSVLPPLAKIAAEQNKEFILKLHPAESLRDRRRIVSGILPVEQQRRLRIIEGPLTEDLMTHAWFAVTGISTTAVECAMRRVPVFLCEWLENWPCRYLDQFAKFSVGTRLKTPAEIQQIPALLSRFEPCDPRQLWNPVNAGLLDSILISNTAAEMAAAI